MHVQSKRVCSVCAVHLSTDQISDITGELGWMRPKEEGSQDSGLDSMSPDVKCVSTLKRAITHMEAWLQLQVSRRV